MSLLGRLSLDALPHDPVSGGGAIMLVGGAIALVLLITYLKKWKYLWREWFTSLDPKRIGIMYALVAGVMLLRGFADTIMIRLQQVLGGNGGEFIDPGHFQQVFSAHGTIMIFFVAMGLIFALMNLIVPLQIGARDVAFPFLNSVSFWLFAAGMVLMNASLVIGEFSGAGWLAYPPLSGLEYSPGVGVDYWIWALQIAGIGSLLSGVNFIVTILKMRAPGMTMMKMPIFVWSALCSMLLVVFAFPILTATLGMLGLDRLMGMHFFTSDMGGNPMMYVNLIWAWGHPEVYILVLPAFGIFSEVVATFSGKRLFGYKSMVIALLAITALSFVVWLHHFFTMGAGANVNAFFGIMTAIIAVPTGVKVFNWLFTMFRGRVRLDTPMLWFLGFVLTFTIGGATGVMMSVPAIDFQVHNSLFLVAHFHNMIIGGVLFGAFAGLAYWWPKFTGFKLNEKLGKIAFWFWIVGFVLAFVPLYILGFLGATRRMDSYDPSLGWQGLFVVAGIGVVVLAIGLVFQVLQIIVSILYRKRLENRADNGDPWDGRTLEWATAGPPPFYNFATTPVVHDRDAFWDMKYGKDKRASKTDEHEIIMLPKNTGAGVVIAGFAFVMSFGLIWHIWWLAAVSFIAVIVVLIVHLGREDIEYEVPEAIIAKTEAARRVA